MLNLELSTIKGLIPQGSHLKVIHVIPTQVLVVCL